jgi:hypothetical protein
VGSFERLHNGEKSAIQISQHSTVPKPNHTIPFRFDEGGALAIATFEPVVLAAIDFDDRPRLTRYEVANERSHRHLSAELVAAKLPPAEMPPE